MLLDDKDYDSYFEDTMKAGRYENRKESVDIMLRSSQAVINSLEKYGVEFPFQNKEIQEKVRETQKKNHNGKLAWNDRNYNTNNFGYLRESQEQAERSGLDEETKLARTGLDKYLEVIFPDTNDWVHDEPFPVIINGNKCRKRPDYRSDSLKLIIEFDGIQHYQKPDAIINDENNIKFYNSYGYKVIRIPYFIQLTNEAVYQMFGIHVKEKLFNNKYTSLSPKCKNTPAYLCPLGIKRMAKEFSKYRDQYETNKKFLEQFDDSLTGLSLLENEINKINK